MSAEIVNLGSKGSAVTPFVYGDREVRTVLIDGEPWFVATDVAKVLEYRDAANMVRMLDDEDKGYSEVSTPGGPQRLGIINESGLYLAIFRSRAEHAKPFRRWITNEVIPSIRKTGSYGVPAQLTGSELMAAALIEAQRTLEAAQERATRAEARIEADRPHTVLGRAVSAGDGDILVKRMADLLTQNGVRVSQNLLFGWLRTHGWLCSNRGANWNAPTMWALDRGFVRSSVVVVTTSSGAREKVTPHITGAGQADLIDGFTSGRYRIEGDAA